MKASLFGLIVTLLLLTTLILGGCAGSKQNVRKKGAARANTNLAGYYLRRGDLDKATQYFKKALKYDPHRVNALWGLAVTNNRKGDVQRAGKFYQRALSVKEKPALVNSYAAFLCQHGKATKAIPLFKKAAHNAHYNHPGVALANAGLCLKKNGNKARGRKFFKKALAKNQNQPMALTQMARIALERGNNVRAQTYMKRLEQHTHLNQGQLKLAARVALAAGNRDAALHYINKYNNQNPKKSRLSIGKLRRHGRNQSANQ